jgi:hypothetical protein
MSKLGVDSSVSNSSRPPFFGMRAAISNRDGLTICSGKTRM